MPAGVGSSSAPTSYRAVVQNTLFTVARLLQLIRDDCGLRTAHPQLE